MVLSLVYWKGYDYPTIGIDDANIYFVYMKNLAEGHGFVWNIGGERVEGFSSFLWTILGALFYRISPAHLTTLLLISCAILSYLTIYKVILFTRKLNHTEGKTLTATDALILFLLIAPRGFIEWNILSLMETALWTYLLVSATLLLCSYYFQDRKIKLAQFCALLVLINLTRPESLAFNLLFIVILSGILFIDYGWKYSLRKTVPAVISHIVSIGALILWRISYFGYPLPNTYYAKVSGSEKSNLIGGLGYLYKFFSNYPFSAFAIPLMLFFGIALLVKWKRGQRKAVFSGNEHIQAVLLIVVFSGLAFPVLTGGDHFGFSRFYQPLLPLLYVAIVNYYFWNQYLGITMHSRKAATAFIVAGVVFSAFFSSKSTVFGFFRNEALNFPEFVIAKNGRELASQLNTTFAVCKQYPSIGSAATGGFGYEYKGKTIDMLGLNNTIMAHANNIKTGIRNHASFDKKGFWQLKPDIVGTVFGGEVLKDTATFELYENMDDFRITNSPFGFIYELYKGIYDDEEFRQNYLPAIIKNVHQDYFVFGYFNKTFLSSLDTTMFSTRLLERKNDVHRLAGKYKF